jgi:hypothetical protein
MIWRYLIEGPVKVSWHPSRRRPARQRECEGEKNHADSGRGFQNGQNLPIESFGRDLFGPLRAALGCGGWVVTEKSQEDQGHEDSHDAQAVESRPPRIVIPHIATVESADAGSNGNTPQADQL